jgi:hypothetical protein
MFLKISVAGEGNLPRYLPRRWAGPLALPPRAFCFIVIPSEARNPFFADSVDYFVSEEQLGSFLA